MISAYNALGQAIFRTIARSAEGNVVLSPASIGMALAMAVAAAAGETEEEMLRALGVDAADLFDASADLLRRYGEGSGPEGLRLRLANALVLSQHGEAVTKAYKDTLAEIFRAEVFDGDLARVNEWVAQNTEGKIQQVLDTLPPEDAAALVNAIYFKAPWAKPFNAKSTYDAHFYLGQYDDNFEPIKIEVRMMSAGAGDYHIVAGAGYRAVRLAYKPRSLGMIIVLPDDSDAIGPVLDAFDLADLARLRTEFDHVAPTACVLQLPRFRARSQASLKPALKQAGMLRAFDWTRANFSRLTGRPPAEVPVAIDDVVHCSVIEVSEEGTEAAGATLKVFHIGGAGVNNDFIVDHPFLFFVVDEATGAILFQGRIVDPR